MKIEDLINLREQVLPVLSLRFKEYEDKRSGCPFKREIVVCGGTGCMSSDSKIIKEEFVRLIKENGLDKDVLVYQSGCFGLC